MSRNAHALSPPGGAFPPSENPQGNPWAGSGEEREGLFCTGNQKNLTTFKGGAMSFVPLWTAF